MPTNVDRFYLRKYATDNHHVYLRRVSYIYIYIYISFHSFAKYVQRSEMYTNERLKSYFKIDPAKIICKHDLYNLGQPQGFVREKRGMLNFLLNQLNEQETVYRIEGNGCEGLVKILYWRK